MNQKKSPLPFWRFSENASNFADTGFPMATCFPLAGQTVLATRIFSTIRFSVLHPTQRSSYSSYSNFNNQAKNCSRMAFSVLTIKEKLLPTGWKAYLKIVGQQNKIFFLSNSMMKVTISFRNSKQRNITRARNTLLCLHTFTFTMTGTCLPTL